jgi:hypothetical protein
MKTFQKFLDEAYLILERSKPKFRGKRTPEEIEALKKERKERKEIEYEDPSPTTQQLIDLLRKRAREHSILGRTPEGKLDTSSPHFEISQKYSRMATGRQLPFNFKQVLDTKESSGITKKFLRDKSRVDRNLAKHRGNNPDVVKPSEHPDTHSSKASEFDKIVHRRRVKRNKEQRNKEAIDTRGREFRRNEIQNTIGRIPGQLSNR